MHRRRQQGFTLLELMATVSILSMLVLLARPGILSWRASARQYELTNMTAQIFRRAAARARETGAAHQVRYVGPAAAYVMTLENGMSPRCRQTNWADACVVPDETINFNTIVTGVSPILVTFQRNGAGANLANLQVCYEPSGRSYTWGTGDPVGPGGLPVWQRQTRPVLVTIARQDAGGTNRQVVLPPGGTPRVRL